MKTRSGVFAVAITVLLLIALTMNSVSAESKAKVKLGHTDADKMKLNHSDAAKGNLNHTNVAREELNHTDADRVNLNHTDVAKEKLNHSDAAREKPNHTDVAKEKLNHSDAAKGNLNHTDAAKVALNPSESMTFPTEKALNELIYDDGTAEDAYAWDSAGNGFAVQFTPPTYPVDIRTARICFWPDWPDSNHEEFAVYVYDDDGPSGEPGTCLGGPIYHTAAAWGWCNVDVSGRGITIENGDFYILYKQLTDDPDCEGLCRDLSLPQYGRSWDYYYDGSWDPWNENYMIRCVVDYDPTDEWTYMVYLDGDNNLEGAAIDDFMEMSSVGSTSDVNIVVQFDRIPGYDSSYGDWTDCKRFHVTSGMTPTVANETEDLGECNMGNPNTLRDFVDWAMTNFSADNYALILWNHGDGWRSINNWVPWAADLKDAKDAGSSRGICWDFTNGSDSLTLQETEQALTGKYLQLLGYDACLMHMVEVVYQVRANAGVSVGSEEVEPWDGWPYDTILNDLTVTPAMNADALGTVIVDRYMDSYGYTGSETQSAMDNFELPNLVAAVDNLAQALINEINGGNWAQVQEARNAAEEIHYTSYIDLYHFAEMVDIYVPGAAAQAQAVMNEVSKMYEAHGSSVPNDHGLSIYYPRVEGEYLASYDNTAFASDTEWNEFLNKYYNPPTQGGDICVFRDGRWWVSKPDHTGTDYSFNYGIPGDIPVIGDVNNDGVDDVVIFRNGKWWVSKPDHTGTDYSFNYGIPGDIPVVGDVNNDGVDDVVIFRNGKWWVCKPDHTGTDYSFNYGIPGDIPVIGDVNNDGVDDVVIFRNGKWWVCKPDHTGTDYSFNYGIPGDIPVIGDVNNDGVDDVVIFRNGKWWVSKPDHTGTDYSFNYGIPGDIPVIGDVNNDGVDDVVIFRNGKWWVCKPDHTGTDYSFNYGIPGDKPVVGDIG